LNDSPVAEVSHVVLGLTVAGLLFGLHSPAWLALWVALLVIATMIVECGLAAAATSTFVTNTAAFRVFVASIFLPLIVGILRHGLTRASLTSALLVVIFGAVMTAQNRRGHDALDARAGRQGAMSQVSGIVAEHDLVHKWLDAPGLAGSPVA
jgi:hypothetical protein